jgi:chromosome segregation ATPase
MKPAGIRNKSQKSRSVLENIKEEEDHNHDVEDEDPNLIRNSQSAKKPRNMKGGVRLNPQRENLTQSQRAERYYELLDENVKLKKHQTELDEDIRKMATRLKRIKTLISKERKLAGGVLGNEFEEELDKLIDENSDLKSEIRKLKNTIKGLKSQSKKGPYGKANAKPVPAHKLKEFENEQAELIAKLRERLKENIKVIDSYKEENLLLRKGNPDHEPSREIIKKMQESDNEIVRMKCSLQEVTANYEGLNAVFETMKKKKLELIDTIRDKDEIIANLTAEITALKKTSGAVDDLRMELDETKREKEDLENRLKELMTEPFFKRETGMSSQNRIAKLEMEREEKDKIIRNFKEKLLNQEQKLAHLEAERNRFQDLKMEADNKYDELKTKYEGSGEMTIETVQKQLMKIDPSGFRKTMEDLNYQGTEPMWNMAEYANAEEDIKIDIDDPQSLLKEIERLKNSKREIAAELEKCQQMLKLQNNLEEEKLGLIREESEQLRVQ